MRTALELTERYQRALVDVACCRGGGGATAVMEKWRGTLVTVNGDGGLPALGRLLLRARKETEAMQMGCVAECGRVLAVLRRALACLGHTRQGAGDARRSLATTRQLGSEPVGH